MKPTPDSPPPALRLPPAALWLVATILIVVAFRAAGWARVADIGARVDSLWLAMALCGNLAIQPFAAIQWRLLLPVGQRIRLRKMLSITALASLAMNTAPALLGHASAVLMLARQPGMCHSSALSILALEQLTEAIAKVVVVVLAILVLPVPDWMQQSAIVLAVAVALFLAAMIVASRHHDVLARWSSGGALRTKSDKVRLSGPSRGVSDKVRLSGSLLVLSDKVRLIGQRPNWTLRLFALAARWADRLEALRTPRRFLAALAACLGMKLVEGLAIIATQHALGVDLPASSAILILAAAGFGSMLPLAPGNLGTYEATVILAYKWLGVSTGDAVALAFVQHFAYLAAATGAGYAVLSLRQIRAWGKASPHRRAS